MSSPLLPVTVIASPAVTPFSVSTGGTVPRRRFQRGCLIKRGKKPVWVGIFREDRLLTDGTIKRIQRKVVLGPCSKGIRTGCLCSVSALLGCRQRSSCTSSKSRQNAFDCGARVA